MRLGEEAFQDQSSRPLEWTPNSELSEIVRGATRQKVLTPEESRERADDYHDRCFARSAGHRRRSARAIVVTLSRV